MTNLPSSPSRESESATASGAEPKSPPKEHVNALIHDICSERFANKLSAIFYFNKKSTFVTPSSWNFFGDYWIGPCIMDTGRSHHILKIGDQEELLRIFSHFKPLVWRFTIGSTRGTTGSGLTLIVKNNASQPIRVCISTDIFQGKVLAHAMGYRFALCGDDIRCILSNESMMARFAANDCQKLRVAQASTVPRLTVSLIGADLLKQSLCVSANDIAFYLNSSQVLVDEEPGEMIRLRDLYAISHALHATLEGVCADVEHVCLDICADFYYMEQDRLLETTITHHLK